MQIFGTDYRQEKGYTAGTHRARSPRETWRDYSRFMPMMGITRLANVTGLDRIGLPVYLAIRPNSRGLSGAQGKGADADSARASALMEAIETWHGERIDSPLRYESPLDLRRRLDVVDVAELGRKAGAALAQNVPCLWIEGWDLFRGAPVWVPYDAVSTNFVMGEAPSPFLQSTNGLASGNHILEAICHALCEVIERDAVALWSFSGPEEQKARQLDLATVDDGPCASTLALLRDAEVFVAAWDITSDIGIPTYTCTLLDAGERPQWRALGAFSGHGAHLSPGVALMRALSEAVQSRLTVISGSRDDVFPRDYMANSNDDDRRRMLATYSTPLPSLDFGGRGSLASASFEEDVEVLLSALRRGGIGVAAVVDLSRPEVGVPVVKVVVPGLEAFMTSVYRPGRRAKAARERVPA